MTSHHRITPVFSIIEWFDSRLPLRAAFLQRVGWAGASIAPVGDDCAFRRYFRLERGGDTRILMEAVPDGQSIATPGHSLHDFLRIGSALRGHGLTTPRVDAADEANGYILMQDFGDRSFKRALQQGESQTRLYELATDVLTRLPHAGQGIALPDYYQSHVHTGRRRLVDWYMPAVTGQRVADGVAEEYLAVWDSIERTLPPCPQGFLHIDFHFENLMLVSPSLLSLSPMGRGQGEGVFAIPHDAGTSPHPYPLPQGEREQTGVEQCGILDFQGAMCGPIPYDLANLLEDARVDVPQDLRQAMLERYCRDMNDTDRVTFRAWYRVLATQFHCRVIGQFIRIAVRDGKDRYLQYIPRLAGYLSAALTDPILKPLAEWSAMVELDFKCVPTIDIQRTKPLIRSDAF